MQKTACIENKVNDKMGNIDKSKVNNFNEKFNDFSDDIGNLIVNIFHKLALFIIAAATIWAFIFAFLGMMKTAHTSVEDLLLLFIYLEIGAMVSIYFKTNRMPVRFLVYVAITALTRELISIANLHDKYDAIYIMMIAGGILVLTLAVLALRFGSYKFPTDPGLADTEEDVDLKDDS